MSTILILAAALAAPPANYDFHAHPTVDVRAAWRTEVRDALRKQAAALPDQQVAALERLIRLADKLNSNEQLSSSERGRLLGKLYRRIQRVTDELQDDMTRREQRIARADERLAEPPRPKQIAAIARDRAILAQWQGFLGQFGGGAAGGQNASNGDRLVEIIEKTIEPDTWVVNGGLGTIEIFRR